LSITGQQAIHVSDPSQEPKQEDMKMGLYPESVFPDQPQACMGEKCLIFTGQKNGRCRPISLGDNPEAGAVRERVGAQEPKLTGKRELVLFLIVFVKVSPVPTPVTAQELGPNVAKGKNPAK
jgi:hypothetical protein